MELTGVKGNKFVINPAFVRHYGHLFTQEGLEFISHLDGTELLKLTVKLSRISSNIDIKAGVEE